MSCKPLRERTALGSLIYTLRLQRGWSREDLARRVQLLASMRGYVLDRGERVNMHPNTIANWEKPLGPGEQVHLPQRNTLHRVAEAFALEDGSDDHEALFQAWRDAQVMRSRTCRSTSASNGAAVILGESAPMERMVASALHSVGIDPVVVAVETHSGEGAAILANVLARRLEEQVSPLVIVLLPPS